MDGELTEKRVRELVNEELEVAKPFADARVLGIVKEAMEAAKPLQKTKKVRRPLFPRRSKKSNTQETKPKS